AALADRGKGGLQAGGADDSGHHPVGGALGGLDERGAAAADLDAGAGKRILQHLIFARLGDCRETRPKRASLLGQQLRIVVGGQRLDGEVFAVARQEIDRALADGAGRAENADPPRARSAIHRTCGQYFAAPCPQPIGGAYRHVSTLPPISVRSVTAGITARRPSSRSRRPPCPGMRPLESFTPNLRLATDSARSPNCSTIASPALISTRGSTAETPRSRAVAQPATAAQAAPPINPAQVFRGLQRGASRGPPKRRPIA